MKRVGSIYSVDALDKEMIHCPDDMDLEGPRFHYATQNGT
jgi:hypothetical protein